MRDTAAVHVLTNVPLTSSHGKKVVAKETMLWEGSDGYYEVGRPSSAKGGGEGAPRKRYLAYDGGYSASQMPGYHDYRRLCVWLTHMVSMAVATERVLVLPTIFHYQKYIHAWEVMDVVATSRFVEWRESSFFTNHRLDVSEDATAAQLYVDDGLVGVRALPRGPAEAPGAAAWYDLPNDHDVTGAYGVATRDPVAAQADVLFVAFEYENHEKLCWFDDEMCLPNQPGRLKGKIPPFLVDLKFMIPNCHIVDRDMLASPKKVPASKPSDECHNKILDGIKHAARRDDLYALRKAMALPGTLAILQAAADAGEHRVLRFAAASFFDPNRLESSLLDKVKEARGKEWVAAVRAGAGM